MGRSLNMGPISIQRKVDNEKPFKCFYNGCPRIWLLSSTPPFFFMQQRLQKIKSKAWRLVRAEQSSAAATETKKVKNSFVCSPNVNFGFDFSLVLFVLSYALL